MPVKVLVLLTYRTKPSKVSLSRRPDEQLHAKVGEGSRAVGEVECDALETIHGQGQPVKVECDTLKRDMVKETMGPKHAEFCRKPLTKRLETRGAGGTMLSVAFSSFLLINVDMNIPSRRRFDPLSVPHHIYVLQISSLASVTPGPTNQEELRVRSSAYFN